MQYVFCDKQNNALGFLRYSFFLIDLDKIKSFFILPMIGQLLGRYKS